MNLPALSKNFPNPFNRYITIAIGFALILAYPTAVCAAGIMDKIKGLVGGVPWTAGAMILTGVIAISGLVARAKWLSKILLAVGTLVSNIGLMLQDGKIDADEMKRAKADVARISAVLKGK